MRIAAAFFILLLIAGIFILGAGVIFSGYAERKGQTMNDETEVIATPEVNGVNDLTITVVFDNNPYKEGLETAWGFACVIDGSMLLNNMRKLSVDPDSIDTVFLSHIHPDHTGGLSSFLGRQGDVTVYLLRSFSESLKDRVRQAGAKTVEVYEPLEVCKNVYSTGQLGRLRKEQSLIVRTDKGLVVIAGCAHPGIVKIVSAAKNLLKDDVLLVMGGFHLEWARKGKVEEKISAFKELGVRYVGPCHCTGEKAKRLFEEHFGENYINTGAGKTITLADLK
ncbi:MAG: MBL fold metallo-hydrolase [Planctomycetota bacterium]|jgi:7,8-dihydropterin-6-yl-methyl-4-(beta-D-ribofuranosyl)aminobenzene 5'-phosphate synthase